MYIVIIQDIWDKKLLVMALIAVGVEMTWLLEN